MYSMESFSPRSGGRTSSDICIGWSKIDSDERFLPNQAAEMKGGRTGWSEGLERRITGMIIIEVMGGLGNQLQQYALYQKMKRMGKDVKLDLSWFSEEVQKKMAAPRKPELTRFVDLPMDVCTEKEKEQLTGRGDFWGKLKRKLFGKSPYFYESGMYHPEIFDLDNVCLSGYWACEKYYADILPALRQMLHFPGEKEETAEAEETAGCVGNEEGEKGRIECKNEENIRNNYSINDERINLNSIKHKKTYNLKNINNTSKTTNTKETYNTKNTIKQDNIYNSKITKITYFIFISNNIKRAKNNKNINKTINLKNENKINKTKKEKNRYNTKNIEYSENIYKSNNSNKMINTKIKDNKENIQKIIGESDIYMNDIDRKDMGRLRQYYLAALNRGAEPESEALTEQEQLREAFGSLLNELVREEMENGESVSIHLRRGDYLEPGNAEMFGGICTDAYYEAAVRYILERHPDAHFYVFSDDSEYAGAFCEREMFCMAGRPETEAPEETLKSAAEEAEDQEPLLSAGRCTVVDWNTGENSLFDMQLMKCCRHNICANSTFSFWGARLNPDPEKIMIRPLKHKNSQAVRPEEMRELWEGWVLIDENGKVVS